VHCHIFQIQCKSIFYLTLDIEKTVESNFDLTSDIEQRNVEADGDVSTRNLLFSLTAEMFEYVDSDCKLN